MCVASMATQFFAGEVPNLKLNSPRKDDESPENLGTMARRIMAEPEDQDMDEAGDGFAPLLKLEGGSLVRCLPPICACSARTLSSTRNDCSCNSNSRSEAPQMPRRSQTSI